MDGKLQDFGTNVGPQSCRVALLMVGNLSRAFYAIQIQLTLTHSRNKHEKSRHQSEAV